MVMGSLTLGVEFWLGLGRLGGDCPDELRGSGYLRRKGSG